MCGAVGVVEVGMVMASGLKEGQGVMGSGKGLEQGGGMVSGLTEGFHVERWPAVLEGSAEVLGVWCC